jgi:hypothetical protein
VSIRRKTIAEARFPKIPEFQELANVWGSDASLLILSFVWRGYDLLRQDVLDHVDASEVDEDLERSVTQLLEPRVRRSMTGDEPFDVQHGPYEHETRQPPPAQPPEYDLAFVLRANPRVMWPLEAKLVRTPGGVARYVQEITDNFLTCRYAPFSREGAMLGYVLSADTSSVFGNIARSVPCELEGVLDFADRAHRTSHHTRAVPAGKAYPQSFTCHHLLMLLNDSSAGSRRSKVSAGKGKKREKAAQRPKPIPLPKSCQAP